MNMTMNPLLQEWNTPRSTPPFKAISDEDYAPAMRAAMVETMDNVRAIANQTDSPTFENTIERLETSSEMLDRVADLLLNLNECYTNPVIQKTVIDLMPELTRMENSIWMDEQLFARVKRLYDSRQSSSLSTEQNELLEIYYQRFVRNGVSLDDERKKQFRRNAEELSVLTEEFNQNALNDTNDYVLHITDPQQLSGLPESVVASAAEEASGRQAEGWMFTLQAPSYRPFLMFADNRMLREQMWRAYNSRGNRGNQNDNNKTLRRIAELRMMQARLLGYEDYASYSLERRMAQSPDKVNGFLRQLKEACLPFAERDFEEVCRYAQSHGADYELQGWDFSYWSEKLKRERYEFDSEQLRPYFRLENVCQGIFGLYNRLYGVTFEENRDIEVYCDDVKVYEIFDGHRFMGVLYLDMFPRANKRSGAWMTEFRGQWNMTPTGECRPLIQVVCNFTKPTAGKPSLLAFDEVETFMHEMGHAMHGMLSDVHYPSVSGTNVRRDFVEMPSQVMENWCYETEFLNTFARHYETGSPIPEEFIEKIRRSEKYLSGWLCLRQLNFGTVDMAYHTLRSPLPTTERTEDFEHANMTELLPAVEGTCVSTAFTHIFCGGYAAGYYGYKWAEVLDADIFSRFKENGIFDRETAEAFRREILSKGGSEHPLLLFRNFMGRDPDQGALMKRCGFC